MGALYNAPASRSEDESGMKKRLADVEIFALGLFFVVDSAQEMSGRRVICRTEELVSQGESKPEEVSRRVTTGGENRCLRTGWSWR